MHAEFGVQLRPSKQESRQSDTVGGCGNVRRTNPERPVSELGHKPRRRSGPGASLCPQYLQSRLDSSLKDV
jgi:hypothetical protein